MTTTIQPPISSDLKTNFNETELREALKRCSPQTIEAAVTYRHTGNPDLVPTIVLGIIERFIEPEFRPVVRENRDSTRLFEDLGIDSLLMVEIIMQVEESLSLTIQNEELRGLRTIGDLKMYLDCKVKGLPIPQKQRALTMEEISAAMPQQPPFLFLQEARINHETGEGSYRISGDESFLEGHFKGNPIFPASIMMEALGQLGVLFLLKSEREEFAGKVDPTKIYFFASEGVRCHRLCRPGEFLHLKVKVKKIHYPLAVFEGTIHCNGERVCFADEVTLTYAMLPTVV
ncbi:MAG: phosphopantetheine-binding protein [Verrucomicrobiota bacterium]|nr:phosphopantetheine-binding protein [Verrucomicrobiota bacterium]